MLEEFEIQQSLYCSHALELENSKTLAGNHNNSFYSEKALPRSRDVATGL